jgi:hypothetical protein
MARRMGQPTKAEQQQTWLWWFVIPPFRVYASFAEDGEAAKAEVLEKGGFGGKPYLAKTWNVRVAQPDELGRHLRVHSTREERSINEAVAIQEARLRKRGLLVEEPDDDAS